MTSKKLYLSDAMNVYSKEFKKAVINLLNSHAGSGKTRFIFEEFLKNSSKYIKGYKGMPYDLKKSKVLYVCDTNMLRDSVLVEFPSVAKALGNGGLIEAKNEPSLLKLAKEDFGTIKVINYSTLGFLLKNEACKKILTKYFEVIIMDEFHQLFDYCKKYNVVEGKVIDGEYSRVIDNLRELSEKTLLVGVTATVEYIDMFRDKFDFNFGTIKNVFTDVELSNIRSFNFEPIYTNSILNMIKTRPWREFKEKGYKTLIYTNTVKQAETYKKYFNTIDINAEWICSTNRVDKMIEYVDEETREIKTEKVPTMRGYKKEIRDRLLNGVDGERTMSGTLPDELDVLIINGAYETGWNLKDTRIKIVLINSSIETVQIQARNRCRFDIPCLYCLCKWNENGHVLTKDMYGSLVPLEYRRANGGYAYVTCVVPTMLELEEKFIGVKINKEMRNEIIYKYGILGLDDTRITWETVKRDLEKQGYIINTDVEGRNGTYIFKEGQIIRKDSKRVVNKMNKLIEFLEKHDGKRLDKKRQDKLKDLVNSTLDGEILKTPSKINDCFGKDLKIDFIIIPKKSGGVRQWLIESIQN